MITALFFRNKENLYKVCERGSMEAVEGGWL